MKLNKTLAVALHRAMWTDMKTELGDNPTSRMREDFKIEWKKRYFPNECVMHNCFLCEYSTSDERRCHKCPIRWPEGTCCGRNFSYDTAPISDILALPEKDLEPTGNGPKYIFDETEAVRAYYTYREELLSKASGLPGSVSIENHIKAIREKAVEDDSAKKASFYIAIAKASDAFKKYAEEQKASIFHTLAEASGLSAGNESVKAHISKIKDHERERIMDKIEGMLNDKSTGKKADS